MPITPNFSNFKISASGQSACNARQTPPMDLFIIYFVLCQAIILAALLADAFLLANHQSSVSQTLRHFPPLFFLTLLMMAGQILALCFHLEMLK